MAVKSYQPYTPSRRFMKTADFSQLTKIKPLKALTVGLNKQAGRDKFGHISVRHQGGGHKRQYRLIDFKQFDFDVSARVESIEYDPNRSTYIALICYQNGKRAYILAPYGLKVDQIVMSSRKKIEVKTGNRLPLCFIPDSTPVYNLELFPNKGGQLVRGAGVSALVLGTEGKYTKIKLPSGEIRMLSKDCLASIGNLSNPDHHNIVIGKAGRKRWLGVRPTVRGKSMNPVDHPHGGGEGHSQLA